MLTRKNLLNIIEKFNERRLIVVGLCPIILLLSAYSSFWLLPKAQMIALVFFGAAAFGLLLGFACGLTALLIHIIKRLAGLKTQGIFYAASGVILMLLYVTLINILIKFI